LPLSLPNPLPLLPPSLLPLSLPSPLPLLPPSLLPLLLPNLLPLSLPSPLPLLLPNLLPLSLPSLEHPPPLSPVHPLRPNPRRPLSQHQICRQTNWLGPH
jgi:hypothetical protein